MNDIPVAKPSAKRPAKSAGPDRLRLHIPPHRPQPGGQADFSYIRETAAGKVKRPAIGVPARRLDHFNLTAGDASSVRDFLRDILGFAEREAVVPDDNPAVSIATWLSVTNLSHDIAIVPEPTNMRGRLHHVCFHYISAQHLFDVAELAKEAGFAIEHGPGRHGIGGATFLYLLEPGGNRVEVMGDPGYMIFDPATQSGEALRGCLPLVNGAPIPRSALFNHLSVRPL